MSVLDLNLENVPELEIVEEGEYELQIEPKSVSLKESQNGNKYIQARIKIVGQDNTYPVFHRMMLPDKEQSEDINMMRKRDIKRFLEAFDLDLKVEFTDGKEQLLKGVKGQKAWAILKVTDDGEYEPKNEVKRFITSE